MTATPTLQSGLFKFGADGLPHLLANFCSQCDLVFFPSRVFCGRCSSSELTSLNLSRFGKVHSFSFIDRKPTYAVIDAPYIQAEVKMPEGVSVFTVLDHCSLNDVFVGLEVEIYVDEVNSPKSQGKVLAYKFRPASVHSTEEVK